MQRDIFTGSLLYDRMERTHVNALAFGSGGGLMAMGYPDGVKVVEWRSRNELVATSTVGKVQWMSYARGDTWLLALAESKLYRWEFSVESAKEFAVTNTDQVILISAELGLVFVVNEGI